MADIRNALIKNNNGGVAKKSEADLAKAFRPGAAKSTALAKPDVRTSLPAKYAAKTNGAVGFIIDATGSRADTWKEAQSIQREMFNTVGGDGNLKMRLVHFGGGDLTDHDWTNSTDAVAGQMADVSCRGGSTQINEALSLYIKGEKTNADSIILIGDSFEEDEDEAFELARKLAAKKIKIFSFHEGSDSDAAGVFQKMAEITGGAFSKFGSDISLKDLCRAVAVFSTGGEEALTRLAHSGDRAAGRLAAQTSPSRLLGGTTKPGLKP